MEMNASALELLYDIFLIFKNVYDSLECLCFYVKALFLKECIYTSHDILTEI